MKHPCYPPRPPAPKPDCLPAPHIIACEKRVIPCFCTMLHVCQDSPMRIVHLLPALSQPTLSITGDMDACGHVPVLVTLPLCLHLAGNCGRVHMQTVSIEVPTWLSRTCHWRESLITIPTVQLLSCMPTCGGFEVKLHITLEFCLLSFGHAPACPSLPLYPPPIHC